MRFFVCMLGVILLAAGCDSDDSGDGSGGSSGAGGTSGSGTTIVACHTGIGPSEGCSEIPLPNEAVQAARNACTDAGSVVSDRCPTMDASTKCTPGAGAIGPLTPNVVYKYGLVDADDIADARRDCDAMRGVFEVL